MPKKPKEGDIIEIPLLNGTKAYGWYLHYSQMGPIIQVLSLISASAVTVDQILASKPLFPPVITGLFAAIKEGKWKVVGHKPVTNFVHPKFVLTLYDQRSGEAGIWFLWDGQKEIRIGPVLPEEYRGLEFLVVWNPTNVVRRIETGEIPFPYADLVKYNKFTPQNSAD
jgi:hypothetical protein